MQVGYGAAVGRQVNFEIKFDGYRCIAVKREREVTLFPRHDKVLNRRFPSVVKAMKQADRLSLSGSLIVPEVSVQ